MIGQYITQIITQKLFLVTKFQLGLHRLPVVPGSFEVSHGRVNVKGKTLMAKQTCDLAIVGRIINKLHITIRYTKFFLLFIAGFDFVSFEDGFQDRLKRSISKQTFKEKSCWRCGLGIGRLSTETN